MRDARGFGTSLYEIETRHGRRRSFPDAPRTLDLDLLLFGNAVLDVPGLKIPHPRMHERRFVLEPLREIAPQAVHPVLGLTVEQLLERVQDPHRVRALGPLADTAPPAGRP